VERLFQRGLLQIVFATGTRPPCMIRHLSLGMIRHHLFCVYMMCVTPRCVWKHAEGCVCRYRSWSGRSGQWRRSQHATTAQPPTNRSPTANAAGTLAAGINMPARTTVVSALSRMTQDGPKPLPHNELLQMAGRAGRRGFDTVGHCVVLQNKCGRDLRDLRDLFVISCLATQRWIALGLLARAASGHPKLMTRAHDRAATAAPPRG
jgi:replicative superfamily II helicase